MTLYRLLYTSKAKLPHSGTSAEEQVQTIADQSARHNLKMGITGLLIFVEGEFIQVLEGDLAAVESTFERICCSFDHDHMTVVDLVSVEERLFGQWGMTLLADNKDASVALRDDLQEIRFVMGINARAAINLMKDCLHIHARGHRTAMADQKVQAEPAAPAATG